MHLELNSSCWWTKKVTAVHVGCFWWFIAHVLMSQTTHTKAEKVGGGINTGVCSRLSFFGLSRNWPLAGPYPHAIKTHTLEIRSSFTQHVLTNISKFFSPEQVGL